MPEGSAGQVPLVVFVVEDEVLIQELLIDPLQEAGYQVLVAENGRLALEALERSARDVALVITDISMPGMSGQELGVELRHRKPKIKVLYLSGYSPQVLVDGGPAGGETEFLGKPFTSAALLEKVRRVLDRG